jgi:flagellar protein FlaI
MGEVRGEEGRTLFQVMSTGHTTYTTFHADSVGEVVKRFTTDPINVSKTLFTALDIVSIQAQTRVRGRKVRRNQALTEINSYDAENDEINVQDVYTWKAGADEFTRQPGPQILEEIMFDRGWSRRRLEDELHKREVILAYLIDRRISAYEKVAATIQAFINDPDTILALVARDRLEESLDDLREMETVFMDIDDETEALVPRPSPDEATRTRAAGILDEHAEMLDSYRQVDTDGVEEALPTDLDWNVESGGDVGDSLPTSVEVDRSLDAGLESPTDEPPEERPTRTEVRAEDISFAGAADDGEGDSGVRTTRYDEE